MAEADRCKRTGTVDARFCQCRWPKRAIEGSVSIYCVLLSVIIRPLMECILPLKSHLSSGLIFEYTEYA